MTLPEEALVFLDPFALARAIAKKAELKLSGPAISQLAWALSNKQGVARQGDEVFLVLRSPLDRQAPLKLVSATTEGSVDARKARNFSRLEGTFLHYCGRMKIGDKPTNQAWVPVLTGRAARITIGGRLPLPTHVPFQDYGVDWYNLDDFGVGGLFFFTDRNNDLTVLQRIGPLHFALAQVANAQNMVDMRGVIESLVPSGERIEGITQIGGTPTLLRPPPEPR